MYFLVSTVLIKNQLKTSRMNKNKLNYALRTLTPTRPQYNAP